MKCALIVPQMVDKWLKHELTSREMLGVQYIAASCEQTGIECFLLNAHAKRMEHDTVCNFIIKNDFKVIGVSCLSQRHYPFVKEFIEMLKINYNYKGTICLGGFYASLAYKQIFEDFTGIDYILRGEGEYTFPMLVKALHKNQDIKDIPGLVYLENGSLKIKETEYIQDLDKLPFPKRDLSLFDGIDAKEIILKMIAGRGCYGECSFCSIIMHSRPRYKIYRSAQNVADEIEYLINTFGVNKFAFTDEIFYDSSEKGRRWVDDFVKIIKGKSLFFEFHIQMRATDVSKEELTKLKSIGLSSVSVGYESGVQRVLDEMKKHSTVEQNERAASIIKSVMLKPVVSFITIIPTMTFDELKENYDFLKRLDCYTAYNLYNKLNVYNGCEYEKILKDKGLLLERKNFHDRDNYKYLDQKVGFFSEIIEIMKKHLVKVRLLIFRMKLENKSNEKINCLIEEYNSWSKESCEGFIEFCIENINKNIYNLRVYIDQIKNEVDLLNEKINSYALKNDLIYNFEEKQQFDLTYNTKGKSNE